ncbi:RHS repeat-associated core domain-containing protein [Aequorivita sp. KMM 9714]|uniref:RHS repeat-associated core domain-containing protein n=1 Tax=Aequorivita sp. KMM 9714 TaxID=2707173 RepID=UPI0013EA54F3|nr:RHS repeat-associated core domain-containing protein [Aequorivita sp. KMM 9714]NGX84411.1 RHS repeat-associated core domain-containing protein [Aequorivita sp. KMM 9714]
MGKFFYLLRLAYKDYYPFGMPMPNRNQEGAYRYAYQGQEKDAETGMEAFELRLWDARIGRWLTTDPYGQYASPYMGMGNNPISNIDPDGGSDCPNPPCNQGESTVFNYLSGEYELDLNDGFALDAVDLGTLQGTSLSFYDVASNLVWALNGGMLWNDLGYDEPPQLIGTLGISGGARAISTAFQTTNKSVNQLSKYGFQALNHIDDVDGVSGLYVFDDATRGMLPYVGKSNVSIASRLNSHYNAGRIGGQVYFKPLSGNSIFLEVQETIMMNHLGGKLGTANKIFPVSPARNVRLNLGITNYGSIF